MDFCFECLCSGGGWIVVYGIWMEVLCLYVLIFVGFEIGYLDFRKGGGAHVSRWVGLAAHLFLCCKDRYGADLAECE